MEVSALICTRNRAESLQRTLRQFFAQQFPPDLNYELVVVDNGSTDKTRAVIEQFVAEQPGRVFYHSEPRVGVCYARNLALAVARGEVVAFTDDDVLVSENWLAEIYREFAADPELYALGGRVLLARPELQPISLQPSAERRVFTFPDTGTFVMGANMAFRRALFAQIGRFDVRLGGGTPFLGGDDTDILYRTLRAGHRLLYAPNVLVHHDHNRYSREQAERLEYSYSKSFSAYLIKHALHGDGYAARALYWSLCSSPQRWRRQRNDSDEELQRRRVRVRGVLAGLLTAPWRMLWGDGETRWPGAA